MQALAVGVWLGLFVLTVGLNAWFWRLFQAAHPQAWEQAGAPTFLSQFRSHLSSEGRRQHHLAVRAAREADSKLAALYALYRNVNLACIASFAVVLGVLFLSAPPP